MRSCGSHSPSCLKRPINLSLPLYLRCITCAEGQKEASAIWSRMAIACMHELTSCLFSRHPHAQVSSEDVGNWDAMGCNWVLL